MCAGDHPLRAIKRRVDAVLQKLSPLFDELYADIGRNSIPPEQLLKARVLTAPCHSSDFSRSGMVFWSCILSTISNLQGYGGKSSSGN
jgi:hypothetical protein